MIPALHRPFVKTHDNKGENNKWRPIWWLSEQLAVSAKDEMMPCQAVALSHTDAIEAAVTEQRADTVDWHRDREGRKALDIELVWQYVGFRFEVW